jgi:hypothetical protein
VAADGAHQCGDSIHSEQGCSSSSGRDVHPGSSCMSAYHGVVAACGSSGGSCNAAVCRRNPKASPFLRYNFAAALNS